MPLPKCRGIFIVTKATLRYFWDSSLNPFFMPKYRAAIIGGGHIADQNHIPALQKLADRVEITAICSRDLTKARALADKYGIPGAFDNPEAMYQSEHRPHIIINCTANNLHYPFTLQALKNGCHVFCEKPPAMNAADAAEMADVAKQLGKTLAYNFQRRHTPAYIQLKKLVQEGYFGHIYHVKADYIRRRGIPGWGNFTNKTIQGGGALIDLGVHILDLALGLTGYQQPRKVVGNTYDFIGKTGGIGLKGAWNPETFEVEDACFGYLSMPDKSSITFSSTFALNIGVEEIINLEIFGTKAGAKLNPLELYTEVGGQLANISFPHLAETDPQLINTTAFLDACDGLDADICSAQQGAVLQQIVEDIYKDAAQ